MPMIRFNKKYCILSKKWRKWNAVKPLSDELSLPRSLDSFIKLSTVKKTSIADTLMGFFIAAPRTAFNGFTVKDLLKHQTENNVFNVSLWFSNYNPSKSSFIHFFLLFSAIRAKRRQLMKIRANLYRVKIASRTIANIHEFQHRNEKMDKFKVVSLYHNPICAWGTANINSLTISFILNIYF